MNAVLRTAASTTTRRAEPAERDFIVNLVPLDGTSEGERCAETPRWHLGRHAEAFQGAVSRAMGPDAGGQMREMTRTLRRFEPNVMSKGPCDGLDMADAIASSGASAETSASRSTGSNGFVM
jgi:hypothetical protein